MENQNLKKKSYFHKIIVDIVKPEIFPIFSQKREFASQNSKEIFD